MIFKGFSPAKNCQTWVKNGLHHHCVKSVQIRSYFWSVFSGIWTEYGDIRIRSPYSVRMRENTDQKQLVFWHFSWSALLCLINPNFIQKNQKKAMSQSWESGVRYGRTNGRTKLSLQDPLAEPMVQKVTRAHVFLLLILHNFLK